MLLFCPFYDVRIGRILKKIIKIEIIEKSLQEGRKKNTNADKIKTHLCRIRTLHSVEF